MLHGLDEPGSPVVTDAQVALHQGNGGAAVLQHHLHGLIVERVVLRIAALLATLVLLFSFKGEIIASKPLTILWLAIPLFLQTMLIFWITYGLARFLRLGYEDAAPSAMIGASNHFEVAIATAALLFGLSSGAALATVVGVLIEVPTMLWLVWICKRTARWFA